MFLILYSLFPCFLFKRIYQLESIENYYSFFIGAYAWEAALRTPALADGPAPRPRPRFGHGAEYRRLFGCFHPSQQNTFTGKLTPAMLDGVLERTRELAEEPFA